MESSSVKKGIKNILYHHIILLVLLIFICFCHILFESKFNIVLRSFVNLFYICILAYFLEVLFLLHLIYLILSKHVSPAILKKNRYKLFFIFSVSLLNGIYLLSVHWANYFTLSKYIEECPYNFNLSHINKLFNGFSQEISDASKKCKFRRCFLVDDIAQKEKKEKKADIHNYICNYANDFNVELKNNFVSCKLINSLTPYENYSEVFYGYLKYCGSYTSFYSCEHKYKIVNKFYLSYNDKCSTNYNIKNYEIIGALFTIIDAIGVPLIWFIAFLKYDKILRVLNNIYNSHLRDRFSPSSLNSTKDNSVVIRNEINNNININNRIIDQRVEYLFYPDPNSKIAEERMNNTRNSSLINDIHNDSNFHLDSKNDLIHLSQEKNK